MNNLKITALEDVEVQVTLHRMVPQMVSGVMAERPANDPPEWIRLGRGEDLDAVMVFQVNRLDEAALPVSIAREEAGPFEFHGLIRVEKR